MFDVLLGCGGSELTVCYLGLMKPTGTSTLKEQDHLAKPAWSVSLLAVTTLLSLNPK